MRTLLLLCLTTLVVSPSPAQQAPKKPVDFVNEYIGTANEGQTFPSTAPPFAMTQWTPQTRAGNIKCVPPYYFAETRLQGFRASHFLSGSCTQDYGSMTVMPISLPAGADPTLKLTPDARASAFDRASEHATPFHYSVTLADYGIDADLTGTTRSGILRFRFNKPGQSLLLIESNAPHNEGTLHIDLAAQEITVVTPVRRIYAGSGRPGGFSGNFTLRFDHPFRIGGTWAGKTAHPGSTDQSGTADGLPGAYIAFDLKPGDTVTARVGNSFTNLDEARHNLASEIPGWDFDRVVSQTRSAWDKALNAIQIDAPDTQKHIFYTAMYHAMQLPRVLSDVSGTYPTFASGGPDATQRPAVSNAKDYVYYDDYSLWDTFRAVHPLFTLIEPTRERDMVRSLIAKGDAGGFLPIYPAWSNYTSEMIGDHADAVIVDAWAKGIRDFDLDDAYRLMRHNATASPATHDLYLDGRGRRGLESYLKYGYIPLEDTIPDAFHKNEQVSRTLEYAYDDALVGTIAKALHKVDDEALFAKRAQNYRNVIDPSVGFARGRHADGTWVTPFEPLKPATYVTEALPIQYTFFVLQDIPGLIDLLGGKQPFIVKLDELFDGKFYDHGNEPSHHIAYLYDHADAAWKTQLRVRNVADSVYKNTPDGIAGNDDCGQISAWYIFSALGFYPVTPGTPNYEIGTPLVDSATLNLPSGKHLRIEARGASSGLTYIQSATLNGKPLTTYYLTQDQLTSGGTLIFKMSATPNKSWPSH
ncbi:GH92 family glycosyl hydrolase [Granulicella paludicola]|uniref:GH92 family glycosyl hydrolase n=1 Tax=Granulicella paludicola TaxID=474951 RepID=UPI0021E00309|nr:GH92 family glycosyl hydrolase [Granulicella paludicola]